MGWLGQDLHVAMCSIRFRNEATNPNLGKKSVGMLQNMQEVSHVLGVAPKRCKRRVSVACDLQKLGVNSCKGYVQVAKGSIATSWHGQSSKTMLCSAEALPEARVRGFDADGRASIRSFRCVTRAGRSSAHLRLVQGLGGGCLMQVVELRVRASTARADRARAGTGVLIRDLVEDAVNVSFLEKYESVKENSSMHVRSQKKI